MIKFCGCKAGPSGSTRAAEYQDREYGLGRRVHTEFQGKSGKGYRCTVCGKDCQTDAAPPALATKPTALTKSAPTKLTVKSTTVRPEPKVPTKPIGKPKPVGAKKR